jgi:hypothetical protein
MEDRQPIACPFFGPMWRTLHPIVPRSQPGVDGSSLFLEERQ